MKTEDESEQHRADGDLKLLLEIQMLRRDNATLRKMRMELMNTLAKIHNTADEALMDSVSMKYHEEIQP